MNARNDVEAVPQAWMDVASRDLGVASRELNAPEGSTDQVCVSSQQAVEKAVKAVLCHAGKRIPHTHDLPYLLSLLPQEIADGLTVGPESASTARILDNLSKRFSDSRYPSISPPPTRAEAKSAFGMAECALEWAKAALDLK